MSQDVLIYEFKNSFFVIQRSQQGTRTNDKKYQHASENVDLFAKLDIDCLNEDIGRAVIGALDKFDSLLPKYDSWELKELNAQLCSWVGSRGINVLNKNSRLVQVIRDCGRLSILPFDNYIKNPWYGPMIKEAGYGKDIIFETSNDSSCETIGKLIFEAFEVSTYNPERKDARRQ